MKLFDSHAHYTDAKFENEYDGGADKLLGELFSSGVCGIVNVGTNVENSIEACRQAAKYPYMYAAVGIHPEDCMSVTDIDYELCRIEDLLKHREELKIVGVGEIGLDYYWDVSNKAKQAEFFSRQLDLSEKYGLPAIIHDRDAHGDSFDMILRHPGAYGVFHSFSGSPELARELTRRGWYISFSGVLTFKNGRKARETAEIVPSGMLLTETDCPYLAPEPYRGKLNHSGLMIKTLEALANARNTDIEAMSGVICENSRRLFGISDKKHKK